MNHVLVIAGVDPCGGAGISADIKTITSLECHALVVVTALAIQNSYGVKEIHGIPYNIVSDQLDAIMEDVVPDAVKIGMMFSEDVVLELKRAIERHRLKNIVLDPVLKASSNGRELLMPDALMMLKDTLLPLIDIVTPNIMEAEALSGISIEDRKDMKEASMIIKDMGPNVVITGGHLQDECVDMFYDGSEFYEFGGTRINTLNTHGSGCVFSSSLASYLSKGFGMSDSVKMASIFTKEAIKKGYPIGQRPGVVCPA